MPDPTPYSMPDSPLHVVICHEDDAYLAQCLEHDIAGHGQTIEEAEKQFIRAYTGNILIARQFNDAPFQHISKAPPEYWHMWVQQTEAGAETHPIRIPGFTVRHKDDRPDEAFAPRTCTAVVALSLVT